MNSPNTSSPLPASERRRKGEPVSRPSSGVSPEGTGYPETLQIPCTVAQRRVYEACGGAAYIRRVLNGSYAFFQSKRRES